MSSPSLAPAVLEALKKIPRDEMLPPDAPERFVEHFVEALDLEALGFVERRRPNVHAPYPVSVLVKLVVFAAVLRIIGHRPLARACTRDVGLLFLSHGKPPAKSTLWRFWRDFHPVLSRVFDELVRYAAEAGLVGMELHALDGTKIRAASSMHTALHREGERKKLTKLERQLERLEDMLSVHSVQELRYRQERTEAQLQETRAHLALLDAHATQHLHPNEPEARVMRCDPRPLLAYNAQAVADHESDLIVAIGLTAEETDHGQLVPMMEEAKRVLGAVAKVTDVDTGYLSGEQLHEAQERHLPVLGPVQAEWDKGLPKSSFTYDPARDVVVCPRGEVLPLESCRKMSTEATCETSIYRCHTSTCPERSVCTQDRKGRTVKRTPYDDDLERQRALLAKPAMRNLYDLRKEIIEHLFGCIKGNDRFRRFTVRGRAKAFAQWALACIALNLRKLYRAWVAGLFRWPPRAPAHG